MTDEELANRREQWANGWFSCCAHCGCPTHDRTGHDDTCRSGCNDLPVEEMARL